MDHQHDRRLHRDMDRQQVPHRVVGNLALEQGPVGGRLAAAAEHQRIAVGGRLCQRGGRDHSGGADTVLHDDGLAQGRAQRLGQQARRDVLASAGCIGHEDPDRLAWPVGLRAPGSRQYEREG
jgi:hypothetical protein